MRYQLDQSGRIEETNRETIVGLASECESFTLRVQARVKRQLLEIFRRQGRPKVFPIVVFGVVAGIAVKKSRFEVTDLEIDIEYPSHDRTIQNLIKGVVKKEMNFGFKKLGKNSPAHKASYFTYIGDRKADIVLRLGEICRYL